MLAYAAGFAFLLFVTALDTIGLIMITEGIYYMKNGKFFILARKG